MVRPSSCSGSLMLARNTGPRPAVGEVRPVSSEHILQLEVVIRSNSYSATTTVRSQYPVTTL